ncbi:MAG: hypothetical protein KA371_04665 [Acidobacteria bacterium]|nr:hypothetical protein [Acidobacteriota bacterium]
MTDNGRDVTDEPNDFSHDGATLDITMTNRAASVGGTVTWTRSASRRRPVVVVFADDDTRWIRGSRVVGTSEVDQSWRFDVRGLTGRRPLPGRGGRRRRPGRAD